MTATRPLFWILLAGCAVWGVLATEAETAKKDTTDKSGSGGLNAEVKFSDDIREKYERIFKKNVTDGKVHDAELTELLFELLNLGQEVTDEDREAVNKRGDKTCTFDEFLQMMFDKTKRWFEAIDKNKKGYIEKEEFVNYVSKNGKNLGKEVLEYDCQCLRVIFEGMDKDKNRVVNFKEFLNIVDHFQCWKSVARGSSIFDKKPNQRPRHNEE